MSSYDLDDCCDYFSASGTTVLYHRVGYCKKFYNPPVLIDSLIVEHD